MSREKVIEVTIDVEGEIDLDMDEVEFAKFISWLKNQGVLGQMVASVLKDDKTGFSHASDELLKMWRRG